MNNQVAITRGTVLFTIAYITFFSINAFLRGNVEFIYYTAFMLLCGVIILAVHKQFRFYPIVLLSISAGGLLHLLGGNIMVRTTRLYDLYIIPGILRYDNIMHMLGSAVLVMVAYAILNPVLADDFEGNELYFVFLLVLIGMGLGNVNEIVEFIAVQLFDVSEQVGGYTNTLLDLIFNVIGSLAMAILLVKSKQRLRGVWK